MSSPLELWCRLRVSFLLAFFVLLHPLCKTEVVRSVVCAADHFNLGILLGGIDRLEIDVLLTRSNLQDRHLLYY